MSREIPKLDKNFLVGFAGWDLWKQGNVLAKSRTFKSAERKASSIKGKIDNGRVLFHPELIFGTSSVPDISCNCRKGRQGELCAHVVATAIFYQASLEGVVLKKESSEKIVDEKETLKNDLLKVRTLKIDPLRGKDLNLIVLLPPNIAQSAPRDSIMTKIELEIEGKRQGLIHVDNHQLFTTTPQVYSAIATLENWCDRKLSSILQLDRKKLTLLLELLKDTSSFRWVRSPNDPLVWKDSKIQGVHEHVVLEEEKRTIKEKTLPRDQSDCNGNLKVDLEEGLEDEYVPLIDGSNQFLRVQFRSREYLFQRELLALLKSNGFHLESSNHSWWLRDEYSVMNFVAEHWEDLIKDYRCQISKNLENRRSGWLEPKIQIQTTAQQEGKDLSYEIEISVDAGKVTSEQVRDSIARGKKFVSDGKNFYLLKPKLIGDLEAAQNILAGEQLVGNVKTKKRVHSSEFANLEEVFEDLLPNWNPPEEWKLRSRALRDLSHLKVLPNLSSIKGNLRPYQSLGSSWMKYLYDHGLAGVLADEMGLGKTLQALVFLHSIHRKETQYSATSLIVCPASLTENWRREVVRFTPDLKVFVHHKANRLKRLADVDDYDLIITSYGTLNRDKGVLKDQEWEVVIGDEAQHIKNRRTQNFKTMTALHTRGRFLLTGTPIENSLEDLCSLFAFLMPGYLAKVPSKISREERGWYDKRHSEQAAHYVLRRTKKEVAPELPEKIEKIVYCDLSSKQEDAYKSVFQNARKEIFEMEMSGASNGKIRMTGFTNLLRMRQICADPRILDDKMKPEDSCKLEALRDILQDALLSGSKILLFSQFVKALSWIRLELQAMNTAYCYLDGSTQNRLAEVDRFNHSPEIPIFLISTKAGGTGLNLTSADTVIHFDPWWNPAIEAQATDRAHRIGQTKKVTTIKLIASGTVEEKIVQMQLQKAKLLQELWEASDAAHQSLSLDEFKSLFEL